MKSVTIFGLVIIVLLILWPPFEYFFIWKPRHKREMKDFRKKLGLDEEKEWRKNNWNKGVGSGDKIK